VGCIGVVVRGVVGGFVGGLVVGFVDGLLGRLAPSFLCRSLTIVCQRSRRAASRRYLWAGSLSLASLSFSFLSAFSSMGKSSVGFSLLLSCLSFLVSLPDCCLPVFSSGSYSTLAALSLASLFLFSIGVGGLVGVLVCGSVVGLVGGLLSRLLPPFCCRSLTNA
jgi:hypothetical protein